MTVNLSNIQHFSTGDGDGIRTTVFLKGCNLRCPWCHNPETQSPEPCSLYFQLAKKTTNYGKMTEPDEIVADVMKDRIFYDETGGGCTLSGGEAMLQPDACAEIAGKLRENGVPTLMDTAGCVPWSHFEKVIPVIDDYYYDIKTADPEKFRSVCGGDLKVVTDNLSKLIGLGKNVHVRIPVIPGFNASEEDIIMIAGLLEKIGAEKVDLLPFHRLGSSKYEAMGKEYAYAATDPPEKAYMLKLKKILDEKGFICKIEK